MAESSKITITFPGGKKVNAEVPGRTIATDQPVQAGGEDSAPAPFSLFLASIGTCAGIYVLGFCQSRGLPADGIRIVQRTHFDQETGALSRVDLDIEVPAAFPAKYHEALVRVADQCKVKKAIQARPEFVVKTIVTN
jgi:putative redox protein